MGSTGQASILDTSTFLGETKVFARTYGPTQYGTHDPKNWDINYSWRGNLLLTNDLGVLTLLEDRWEHFIGSNLLGGIRYINQVGGNTYHIAQQRYIGSLTLSHQFYDNTGQMKQSDGYIRKFESGIGEVLQMMPLHDGTCFLEKHKVHVLSGEKTRSLSFDHAIYGVPTNEGLLIHEPSKACYLFEGDVLESVPGSEILNKEKIVLGIHGDSLLAVWCASGRCYQYGFKDQQWKIQFVLNLKSKITCAYKLDDQNMVLLAVEGNGIYVVNNQGKVIERLSEAQGIVGSAIEKIVSSVNGELCYLSEQGVTFFKYPSPFKLYGKSFGLMGQPTAMTVWENTLYVGTKNGLYSALGSSDIIEKVNILGSSSIHQLLSFGSNLLIASDSGLYAIDEQQKCVRLFKPGVASMALRTRAGPFDCVFSSGRMLYRIHEVDGVLGCDSISEVGCIPRTLEIDKEGRIWIGTHDEGIFVYNYNSVQRGLELVKNLHSPECGLGLGKINVISIGGKTLIEANDILKYYIKGDSCTIEYLYGSLFLQRDWSGNYYAIRREKGNRYEIRLDDLQTLPSNGEDGLWDVGLFGSHVMSYPAICYDPRDSTIWLSTSSGILKYDESKAAITQQQVSSYFIRIEATSANTFNYGRPNETYLVDHTRDEKIVFSPGLNKIRVDFYTNYSGDRTNSQYIVAVDDTASNEYTLVGQHAMFYGLSPGKHVIKVYKMYLDFTRRSKPAIIEFEILPEWYQTTSAKGLWVVLFLLSSYVFARSYGRRLELQKDRLKKIVQDRTQEIQQQNAVLKEKNTRIEVLMADTVHRTKGHIQLTKNLLEMQARRMQDQGSKTALNDAQHRLELLESVQTLILKSPDEEGLIVAPFLNEIARSLQQAYGFANHHFSLELDIDHYWMRTEAATYLGLLTSEILMNAFKYAFKDHKEPKLKIAFKKVGQGWELRIMDNGPGIELERKSGSYGQQLIQLFAEQLDAVLNVYIENGTVFELRVD